MLKSYYERCPMTKSMENAEVDIYDLSRRELSQIVWNQLGVRAPLSTTTADLHKMLAYEATAHSDGDNDVNDMRDEIIAFITKYKDRLSLPCDGDCYQHSDGVVISCHRQLQEDTDGKAND